jgi:hypothetical protein
VNKSPYWNVHDGIPYPAELEDCMVEENMVAGSRMLVCVIVLVPVGMIRWSTWNWPIVRALHDSKHLSCPETKMKKNNKIEYNTIIRTRTNYDNFQRVEISLHVCINNNKTNIIMYIHTYHNARKNFRNFW